MTPKSAQVQTDSILWFTDRAAAADAADDDKVQDDEERWRLSSQTEMHDNRSTASLQQTGEPEVIYSVSRRRHAKFNGPPITTTSVSQSVCQRCDSEDDDVELCWSQHALRAVYIICSLPGGLPVTWRGRRDSRTYSNAATATSAAAWAY